MLMIPQAGTTPSIQWTRTASTPITGIVVNNLKTWINRPLEDTFWDTEAVGLIMVAQRAIERYCELAIAPGTWVGTLPRLEPLTILTRRPFLTVTKVEYVDPTTGTITEVDASTYLALPAPQYRGQLLIADGYDWPVTASRPDAFRITATSGWPLDTDSKPVIPEEIMHALAMTVAQLDAHRGDEGGGGGWLANTVYGATHSTAPVAVPPGAQALLAPYKLLSVWGT